MKITNILSSLLLATWFGAIAIFASQNLTSVSLKFLVFQSINIPLGQLLAFSVGLGMVIGAIAPLLWQTRKPKKNSARFSRQSSSDYRRDEPLEDWMEQKSPEW